MDEAVRTPYLPKAKSEALWKCVHRSITCPAGIYSVWTMSEVGTTYTR